MPDFWSHILSGELVVEKIKNNKLKEKIKNNQQLFNFGCQGPDFLFYNDFWPWINNKRGPQVGEMIHQQKVASFFLNSLSLLKKRQQQNHPGTNLLKVYLSGLITHYTVDKTAHPFINLRSDQFAEHKKLEINLDTWLIKKYKQEAAYKLFPGAAINFGSNFPLIIKKYYQYILTEVYSLNQEINFLDDALADFKQVLSLFYSPYRLKVPGFKLLNLFTGRDLSNLIYPKKPKLDQLSPSEIDQFESLFLTGVNKGAQTINAVESYLANEITYTELKDYFPQTNFLGESY